ncbi:MAG: hypothetical protein ACXWC9_07790 [Pseudobdellovibrionaceae bacterium]
MKKNYGFDAKFNKIKLSARDLWMGCEHGEGELEIENQGRFTKSHFTQETEAIGQQTPRIGESRSTLRFTQRVSSAGCTLNSDSTPHFSFSGGKAQSSSEEKQEILFPLRETQIVASASQFVLQENFNSAPREPRFSLASQSIELFPADFQLTKTISEQATMHVAGKTQNRLASLFKAASLDEDPTV